MLHTTMLRQRFGPIHAIVLRHAYPLREVRIEDGGGVLRTYAITFLCYDRKSPEILDVDQEIEAGGLIGETFQNHGYNVLRHVVDAFYMATPQKFSKDFSTPELAVQIVTLSVQKGNTSPVRYGMILEIGDFPIMAKQRLESDSVETFLREMILAQFGVNSPDEVEQLLQLFVA